MRMRKLFALILALVLALSLAACGNSSSPSGSPSAEGNAPSGGNEIGLPANDPVGNPVNLIVASAYKDSDAEGMYLNYFMDYVTEKSGGAITFTKYMAGTLGTSAEEVGMMKNGDVDVIAMFAPAYAFEMPEFTFILNAVGTAQDSVDFFHYICYDNPETAQLYTDAIARYNGTLLGGIFAVGRTVFPCTTQITGWDDIRQNMTLGAISSYPEQEGYKSYTVISASEYYENLRTGLVQCVETSVDSALTGKLYEVAPYVLSTQIYSPFIHMVMNSDSFNALSEEQKQIVKDAAAAAEAYSLEVCDANYGEFVSEVEAAGGFVLDMTQAELDEYWDCQFKANYSSILVGLAPAAGAEEQADIIVGAILDYWETGYTTDDVRGFAAP